METFLVLNGFEIEASVDDQERIVLDVAAGRIARRM
jgi:death-on-curing protein